MKLSWLETAREMAVEVENWGEWDATLPDGTDGIPWHAPAQDGRSISAKAE